MADRDSGQSFTLWYETLPSSDTARLLISPRGGETHAVFYWNGELHSDRMFPTLDEATAWGQEFLRVLQHDALAGALVGYDAEVLDELQARCAHDH